MVGEYVVMVLGRDRGRGLDRIDRMNRIYGVDFGFFGWSVFGWGVEFGGEVFQEVDEV